MGPLKGFPLIKPCRLVWAGNRLGEVSGGSSEVQSKTRDITST